MYERGLWNPQFQGNGGCVTSLNSNLNKFWNDAVIFVKITSLLMKFSLVIGHKTIKKIVFRWNNDKE